MERKYVISEKITNIIKDRLLIVYKIEDMITIYIKVVSNLILN